MENAAVTEVQRKLFDVDKLCFTKCVKEAANKFKTKEEMCLDTCLSKTVNALEFMQNFDSKGGLERRRS